MELQGNAPCRRDAILGQSAGTCCAFGAVSSSAWKLVGLSIFTLINRYCTRINCAPYCASSELRAVSQRARYGVETDRRCASSSCGSVSFSQQGESIARALSREIASVPCNYGSGLGGGATICRWATDRRNNVRRCKG